MRILRIFRCVVGAGAVAFGIYMLDVSRQLNEEMEPIIGIPFVVGSFTMGLLALAWGLMMILVKPLTMEQRMARQRAAWNFWTRW